MNVGDLVELKSGGPRMTVRRRIDSTGDWRCAWFDGANVHDADFLPDTLMAAREAGPVPPPVCTGSNQLAVNQPYATSSIPSRGTCGICRTEQDARCTLGGLIVATHPYRPVSE